MSSDTDVINQYLCILILLRHKLAPIFFQIYFLFIFLQKSNQSAKMHAVGCTHTYESIRKQVLANYFSQSVHA